MAQKTSSGEVLIIDVVLVLIISVFALIAARLLPSKEKIESNETDRYKSSKHIIYIAGGAALFVGILLVLLYAIDEQYQKVLNIPKMIFLMVIGIGLIGENIRKSRMLAKLEGAGVAPEPVTISQAELEVITPAVVTQPIPRRGVRTQPKLAATKPALQATSPVKVVIIKCPKCQGAMEINKNMVGQKVKCPHCGVEGRIG